MAKNKIERVGEKRHNRENCLMILLIYNRSDDIVVEFQDEYKYQSHTTYDNFKRGAVRNPYFKKEYGIGFIGEIKIYADKERRKPYDCWHAMMSRCYDRNHNKNNDVYIGCSVCDEWHCYKTFEKWYIDNYYKIESEKMCLDKDILIKGNKIYSPETCIFVPHFINCLFITSKKKRGNYCIGVSYNNKSNKFTSSTHIKNKSKHLGYFNNQEEAFYMYKTEKEKYIKQVAELYKNKIPKKLYDAIYRWEININD